MRNNVISKKDIQIAVDKKKSIDPIEKVPCYWGKITIKDHYSNEILIPIEYWSLKDYKKQWKEALDRIQTHDMSCIVIAIEEENENHYQQVVWYLLYKREKKVIIQHRRFCDKSYKKYIGKISLTPQNCYDFIPKYDAFDRNEHEEVVISSPKKIAVIVTDDRARDVYDRECIIGKIKVGAYSQKINIPIDFWSMSTYKLHWKNAIDRIESHNSSCIVTRVMNVPYPLLEWWLLYKKDGKIIAHNDFIFSCDYTEKFGTTFITPDNCYELMPTYQEHMEEHRMEEWIIDLDDL